MRSVFLPIHEPFLGQSDEHVFDVRRHTDMLIPRIVVVALRTLRIGDAIRARPIRHHGPARSGAIVRHTSRFPSF